MIPAMGTDPSVPWLIPYAELSGMPSRSIRRLNLADPDAADAADLRDQIGRTPERPYVALA
jgi:hypothetical protein